MIQNAGEGRLSETRRKRTNKQTNGGEFTVTYICIHTNRHTYGTALLQCAPGRTATAGVGPAKRTLPQHRRSCRCSAEKSARKVDSKIIFH